MKHALNIIILLSLLAIGDLFAQQPGQLDPSFNPTDVGFGLGDGASNIVRSTAIQADGKIIIGGEFVAYNGRGRLSLARLNSDGTLDTGFNPNVSPNGVIYSIVVQPDGKILIGGEFTTYNGVARNRIARLNANGSLDNGFDPGAGAGNYINSIALQPDGKIIIGGNFLTFNGVSRSRIARLNADGSLDTGFNPGSGANQRVTQVAVHPTGKLVICGEFTTYNGITSKYIALLKVDGSLDASFSPGTGPDNYLTTLAVQPDGKIIIGGYLSRYNNVGRNFIARLNLDGSLDTGFNPGTGGNSILNTIALQPDGKIVIGGYFTSFNNAGLNYIARLNSNGSLDASFNPGVGASKPVNTIAVQADGKLILGGNFTSFNGSGRFYITRCNTDGSPDIAFNPGTGLNSIVRTTIVQPDGKILISGDFTSYNNSGRNFLARINANSSLDNSFNPGQGADLWVNAIALQPDGKIVIGGWFTSYNGVTRTRIARVNADGSLDTNFNPGTGTDNWVETVLVQPDGKIIIGGAFSFYNGTPCNRIARLNADGALDTSFNPGGTGANNSILKATLQADGKIIIGGNFTSYNGTAQNHIARLNPDGSLDAGFNTGQGTDDYVNSIALQADGKILVGGNFITYNGISRIRIVRLNTNGTLDTSFEPWSGANSVVLSIGIQTDNRIIIGGNFNKFNTFDRFGIARLNSDGTLDFTFDPGTGVNGSVLAIAFSPDGKAFIGGSFTQYNGTGRNRLAKLHLGSTLGTHLDPDAVSESKLSVYPNPVKQGQDVTLKIVEVFKKPGKIYVVDALGKLVMQQEFGTSQKEIKLKTNNLPKGAYQINVASNKYFTSTKVVIH